MQRDAGTFTSGIADNILAACNDARQQCQQRYTWQQLRTKGAIYLNGPAGGPWNQPVGGYGPYTDDLKTAPLLMKSIDSVWNYTKTPITGVMVQTNKIDFATEQQFKHLLPTNMGFPFSSVYPSVPPYYYNTVPSQQMFAYVVGQTLYVNTASTPSWFMIYGTQLQPDLDGSETSDFFLDNYQNLILYMTLQNLNTYLKDDQRVLISQSLLDKAFEAATFDDANVGGMGEWANLD